MQLFGSADFGLGNGSEAVPTDAWNDLPYRLERDGQHIVVACNGFDGLPNTEDDITTVTMRSIEIGDYLKLVLPDGNRGPR